jgi:hypothetical protein
MKEFLQKSTNVTHITFDTIFDYFIVIVFMLKKLGVSKNVIKKLVKNLVGESEKLRKSIPISVHSAIMGTDFRRKTEELLRAL